MCHLSSLSVKNILNDAKSLTVHLWRVRNLYLHSFYEIHAKGTLLGCILSQHSCINPFFSVPSSVLPSWFLSGRVHLRLFKLTGYKCFHKHLFLCTGPIDNSASEFIFLLYKIQRYPLCLRIKFHGLSLQNGIPFGGGGDLKTQTVGPQNVSFKRFVEEPKNLLFEQIPKWGSRCGSRDHTLRTTDLIYYFGASGDSETRSAGSPDKQDGGGSCVGVYSTVMGPPRASAHSQWCFGKFPK